jgi:hypothetical protein
MSPNRPRPVRQPVAVFTAWWTERLAVMARAV